MNYKQSKLFIQGVTSLKEHNYDKAYTIFNILYKNYPFDEIISLYYGYVLFKLSNFRLALRVWEKLENNPKYDYFLLKAFILIKQNLIPEAIELLLLKLKEDKNNKIANKLLKDLKKSNNLKLYSKYLKFEKVFGKLPYYNIKQSKFDFNNILNNKILNIFLNKKFGIKLLLIIIIIVAILFILNTYFFKYNIFNFSKNKIDRININYLPIEKDSSKSINNNTDNINNNNNNNYDNNNINDINNNSSNSFQQNNGSNNQYQNIIIYDSEKEIERDFQNIKKAIVKKRFNKAQILINKILNSNAKLITKQKAELFEEFLLQPAFDDNFYNPSFNEVIQAPYLYNGIYIKWKGIVNSIDKKDKTFEALVYEKSDIFIEGIIIGRVEGDLYLFKKQKIQFMGKIESIKNNKIYLKITYIKNLF